MEEGKAGGSVGATGVSKCSICARVREAEEREVII